jgi:hypothetical protein
VLAGNINLVALDVGTFYLFAAGRLLAATVPPPGVVGVVGTRHLRPFLANCRRINRLFGAWFADVIAITATFGWRG